MLIQPFLPFPAPNPQTKASFETKTSAISVAPSPHGRYDITQIKDDSLWLSNKADIDEVSALRITVLEWQSRPAAKLLREDLNDSVASAQANGGASSQAALGASLFLTPTGPAFSGKDVAISFDTLDARRQRLLELYLSERRYLIKTCEHIISKALYESTSDDGRDTSICEGGCGWIITLGHNILSNWDIHGHVRQSSKNFFVVTTDAIDARIRALESGSGWSDGGDIYEELELAYERNQILEIIHAMQIMLILLNSSIKLPRSDACLGWFRLMFRFRFFESFQPVSPSSKPELSVV